MGKSADAFRTISEVSDLLDTPTHVLRFWESKFTQVKPVKRAGGRRYYRPADVALLGGIKHLLHEEGMTIRGVQKLLREEGIREVAARGEVSVEDEREADEATRSAPEPIAPVAAPQHSPAPQEAPQAQNANLGEPEWTEAAPDEIVPQEEAPQEAASLADSAQDTAEDESQTESLPDRPEELLDLSPAEDTPVEAHQGGSVTPFPAPSQPSFFEEPETAFSESPEEDAWDEDAEAPMALDVEPEPEPMAPVVAMTIDRGPQERAAKIAARADLARLLHGLRTLDPARLSPADRGDLRMLRLRAQALQVRLAQHGSAQAE
ncbi:MerR family transcriptional regulator [Thioclava sp. F28-4]|uniref:MerR family transcriptional regulator n=1 Tax=Thioclava sp. F28-4 TaxID=1915315 RepID=UPI000998B7FE|nr:MerR family transcriptional regulator [Thioclava sp. F28-4]